MRRTILLALVAFAAGYFLRGESAQTRSERRAPPVTTPAERETPRPVTPAGGTVRGRVTADEKPLAGVLVVATHRERYGRGDGQGAPAATAPRHEARTGADGAYVVRFRGRNGAGKFEFEVSGPTEVDVR